MKKFTLFEWFSDNEGGIGTCKSEEFDPIAMCDPESGWNALPAEKIGEFDTIQELAQLLLENYSDLYSDMDDAMYGAHDMMPREEDY